MKKVLKAVLLSLALLLICNIGALAEDTTPVSYFNGTEVAGPVTATKIADNTTLNFDGETGADGPWYFAEDSASNVSIPAPTGNTNTGTINIIIASTGGVGNPAATFSGNLTIGAGQEVNIYSQTTTGTGTQANTQVQAPLSNCYLNVNGTITVSGTGAELNVFSGAVNGVLNQGDTTGSGVVLQQGGAINIEPNGELQCSISPKSGVIQANGQANINGLSISGGTLTNSGYLKVIQNVNSMGSFTAGGINNTAGASSLVVNGGTVLCSNSYTATSVSGTGGIWLTQALTTISKNVSAEGGQASVENLNVVSGTTFGSGDVALNLGADVSPNNASTLTCVNGNILTITDGVNLIIPDEYTLTFNGTGTTTTSWPTLDVKAGAILTLQPEANVTMGQNSVLTNNGTINVNSED